MAPSLAGMIQQLGNSKHSLLSLHFSVMQYIGYKPMTVFHWKQKRQFI